MRTIGMVMLALVFAACAHNGEASNMKQPEVIAEGGYSGVAHPEQRVIRDPAEWERLWSRHAGEKAAPEVDFEREMVVAAFAGEFRTGGYSIDIDRLERTDEGLVVHVVLERPGATCMTTQALTQPFQIARVPRVDGEVEFRVRTETRKC